MKIRDARSARKSDGGSGGDADPPDETDEAPPPDQKSDEIPTAELPVTPDEPETDPRPSKARRAKPADRSDDKPTPADTTKHEPPRERIERAQQVFDGDGPLLADADGYQERWDRVQIGFVDEPLYAVESAGRLVAEVLGELASTFAARRKELEGQWRHDHEISTEELRQVFRGYRAFFSRIIR